MTCLTLIIAFTAIFFTAKDVIDLQVAEILCGIVRLPPCFLKVVLTNSLLAVGSISNTWEGTTTTRFSIEMLIFVIAVTITYASEVCPVALRGYLTTYVNFCWGLGQVIGIGVIKSMLGRTDEWAYR
jgi:SP family general alpha glucoside:H+ symporter-like MFS transporter